MWRHRLVYWIHAIIISVVSVLLRNETVLAQEVNDDICHGALLLADVNNDGRVDRDEFPYFAILLSNNESCQLVEGVFDGLACLCRRFDDQPRNCCQRNNAHISLLALTQAEPTVNQQMALRATCQVAGQAIQAAGCVDTLFNPPNPPTTSPTRLELPNDPSEPPDPSTPTLASTSTSAPTYTASSNAPSWFPRSASPTQTSTLPPTTIAPTTIAPSTLSPTQNVGTTLDSTIAAAASSSSNRLSGIVITAIVMLCMAAVAVLWHFGSKYHWSYCKRPYQKEQDDEEDEDVERRGSQKSKTQLVAESMPTRHVTHSPTALHHDNDSIGESHFSLAEMSVLSYPAERSPLVGHHRRVVSEESCEIYADHDDSDDEERSNVIRAETCSSSSEFKDASSSDGSLPSELSKGRSIQEQTSWDPSWEGVMSLVESTDEEGFRTHASVHQESTEMSDKDENVRLDDDYHLSSSSSSSLQPSSQDTDASLQDDTVHSMVQDQQQQDLQQPTFLMDGKRRIYNSFSTDGAISSSPTPYEDYSYAASKPSFDESEAGRSQPSRNADPRESHSRTIPENTTNRPMDEDVAEEEPRTTSMNSHYEQPLLLDDDEEKSKRSFSNCDESTMSSPQSTFFPQRQQHVAPSFSQDDRERFSKSPTRSYKEEANEELASILERIKNKRTRHPRSDVSRNEEKGTESFVPFVDPSTDAHLGMAVKPMQSTSDEAHRELASILERIEEKKRARNQQTQVDATVAKTQIDTTSVSEKDPLLEMAIKPSLSSSKEAHEELASILERIEKKRARNRQRLQSSEEKVNSSSIDDMTGRSIYSSRSTKRNESPSKGAHISVTNETTTRRRRKPKMPDVALDKVWKQPQSKAKETKQDYRGTRNGLLFQSPGSFASSVAPSMDDGSSLDVSNSSEVLLEERRYERSQRKAKKKRDTPDHEETQTRSAPRNDTETADSDPNSGDSVDHIVGSIDNIVGSIDNMIGYNLT